MLNNALLSNAGSYYVIIKNSLNTVQSNSAVLTVNIPSVITSSLQYITSKIDILSNSVIDEINEHEDETI